MEWFKHMTCSHDDPDISDAWDMFGDAGPVVFWTTLEVFGKEFSHIKDEWLTLSIPYFERKLRRKWKKIEQILEFFQKRERIYFQKSDHSVSITIPKFIKIASNWTVRPKLTPTEVTTEVTQESPTAKEEEVEEEKKKIVPKKEKPRKPSLTDEQFFEVLKGNIAYKDIDIETQKGKCEAWCLSNNRTFTRRTFVNWLNRAEKPIKPKLSMLP